MAKATGPLYDVHFRRRSEGRTDYSKRLALLKGNKTRLVVRKTNRYILVQAVNWGEQGDVAVTSATSRELKKFGFDGKSNTPSAYLTGFLCGVKAKAKGVGDVVFDMGLYTPSKGSVVYAALKGAVDAGLKANFGAEKMPSADRVEGKHLKGADAGKFAEAKSKISSFSPQTHQSPQSKAARVKG